MFHLVTLPQKQKETKDKRKEFLNQKKGLVVVAGQTDLLAISQNYWDFT